MLSRLPLLVGAILLSLIGAELLVRSLEPTTLGFEFRNDTFLRPTEFEIDPARNRWGFHDVEPELGDSSGRRVLLLGDSYVAGLYLPIEQTLPRRFEARLRASSGEQDVVVALAQPGFSQRHQLAALRDLGERVRPDLVITVFLPFNDVRGNSLALETQNRKEYEEMRRFRPGWTRVPAEEAPWLLWRGSALNRLISHRLAMRRTGEHVPTDYMVYRQPLDGLWQDAWAETEDLLRSTRRHAENLSARYAIVSASTPHGVLGKEEGLKLLLETYPAMREHKWDLDAPGDRLAAFCRTEGIPFLSLVPEFRRQTAAGQRLHFRYDGHWNADGIELAARLLAEFVIGLDAAPSADSSD